MYQSNELLKLNQVLQLVPVSRSTWLRGIEHGIYPKPVKISSHLNAWRAQVAINAWLRQYNQIRPHHALGMRPPVPETLLEKTKSSGTEKWG